MSNEPRTPTTAEIEAWIARVQQEVVDPYFAKNFPTQGSLLSLDPNGRRYARIVSQSVFQGAVQNGRSCWGFIDLGTGDVLKSDGWKRPAKHARGNIFSSSPLANIGPHGPAYLR